MAEARYFLRGEVDLAERDRVRDEIAALIDPPTDLLIDCRDLAFIDSSGISALVETHRLLESHGHHMLLVNVNDAPRRVLEILNLTDLFSIERGASSAAPYGVNGNGNGNA